MAYIGLYSCVNNNEYIFTHRRQIEKIIVQCETVPLCYSNEMTYFSYAKNTVVYVQYYQCANSKHSGGFPTL